MQLYGPERLGFDGERIDVDHGPTGHDYQRLYEVPGVDPGVSRGIDGRGPARSFPLSNAHGCQAQDQ